MPFSQRLLIPLVTGHVFWELEPALVHFPFSISKIFPASREVARSARARLRSRRAGAGRFSNPVYCPVTLGQWSPFGPILQALSFRASVTADYHLSLKKHEGPYDTQERWSAPRILHPIQTTSWVFSEKKRGGFEKEEPLALRAEKEKQRETGTTTHHFFFLLNCISLFIWFLKKSGLGIVFLQWDWHFLKKPTFPF